MSIPKGENQTFETEDMTMTREKKEITKKIDWILTGMEMDERMGCGLPPAVYEAREREIYQLQEKLARLQHYASVEAMLHDTRGCENAGCLW